MTFERYGEIIKWEFDLLDIVVQHGATVYGQQSGEPVDFDNYPRYIPYNVLLPYQLVQ